MTGRAAGYCAGYAVPGFVNPVPGGGLGLGFGCRAGGRGWRHVFYATGVPGWMRADYQPPAPEAELAALKAQASALGDQLDAINQRIEELESHRAEEE